MKASCRLCGGHELVPVLDLGATPRCELYLSRDHLDDPEVTYPLRLRLCPQCLLLQIPASITPQEAFPDDAYFSSSSEARVEDARRFVNRVVVEIPLADDTFVVEVASNDGYLLQHVVARGIRCLGVEPSAACAAAARERGVPTVTEFLDERTAAQVRANHGAADLVIANNVWAHVPDVVGFATGLRHLVADTGWVCIEEHHALSLVAEAQFDRVCHQHYQYWSVRAAERALAGSGLRLIRVERISTHGGSIRLWAAPIEADREPDDSVAAVQRAEVDAGLDRPDGYAGLAARVSDIRADLVAFLIGARRRGKTVLGYGAPSRAQTLLNFCGIRTDLLGYVVDGDPAKHGRFTPGMRIPIFPTERLDEDRPDYVLVLAWELREEIVTQLSYIGAWSGRFVFAQPRLEVLDPEGRPLEPAAWFGGTR